MTIQQKNQYLIGKDLVRRWGVSICTVERLRNENSLPYMRIGKQPCYPLNLVETYETKNKFLLNEKNTWGLAW